MHRWALPCGARSRKSPMPVCMRKLCSRLMRMGNRMQTIAIVEDDPSMLQGLNRLLLAHGFRVQTVYVGRIVS